MEVLKLKFNLYKGSFLETSKNGLASKFSLYKKQQASNVQKNIRGFSCFRYKKMAIKLK